MSATLSIPFARPSGQVGASMIEVLISVLLLSFSLLGIAGLMSATTRYQLGVESRSALSQLFNDGTSRLRTNLTEVPNFDPVNTTPAYAYTANWTAQQSSISAPGTNCGPTATADCSNAQRAAYDIWEMRTMARRALPQGSLLLTGDITAGLTITYMWMDKDFTESAIVNGSSQLTLRTSATCQAGDSNIRKQSCCPAAAAVSAVPGVRCANFVFVP